MEESVKLAMPQSETCPLCQSAIRLFFVNYHEKLLMCENEMCEFPFGYEELQFFTVNSSGQLEADEEAASIDKKEPGYGTTSLISTSALSEIDKLVRCEEMNTTEICEKILRENAIQKNLDDISKLNNQLYTESQNEEKKVTIHEEKWLRNLKTMQEVSGVNLLKPEEIKFLKKEEPVIGDGELRIDIVQGDDDDVKIEIHNEAACSKDKGPV